MLLSFILLVLVVFYQFSYLLKTKQKTDFSDFKKAIAELDYIKESKEVVKEVSLFYFNPNTLDDQGWIALGLAEGKLKVLRNYQVGVILNKLWT